MSIIYWGKEITSSKPLVFTPPYMYVLQLSNVAVEIDGNQRKRHRLTTTTNSEASTAIKENKVLPSTTSTMGSQNESKLSFEESSVRVYVETEDLESNPIKSLLCTLRYGTIDQVSVNMVFSWDSPLRLSCEHSETSPDFKVHIIGYLQPGPTPEGDDSDEDEMGMSYPITWDGNPMENDEDDDDSYEDDDDDDEEEEDDDDEEDDDCENDEGDDDYEDDDEEDDEEDFPPLHHHHLLFDDNEMETDDSEIEMGREYDISKDAVDPEEVKAWKKQRNEANQTVEQKSTQNKSSFEKTPIKHGQNKSKNDERKREKLGKGKTKENRKATLTQNESDDELPEEVSSSKKESKVPKVVVMEKEKKNNKKRKRRN